MESISLFTWESGLQGWTAGRYGVVNAPTFSTPDWASVGNLPLGRAGKAAFVADPVAGNCTNDIETGVLTLTSPLITLPANAAVPRISFVHWFETEYPWDGGNLRYSLDNGASYQLLPESAIEINPYNATLILQGDFKDNPLAGQPAYSGPSGGAPGAWAEVRINLLGLAAAGQQVRLRFDFGLDGCGGRVGWYVDDVDFYYCSAELAPSDCGNGILDPGEQCDDANDFIGDGCSNTCQVEAGWQCTQPKPPGTVGDPGFEAGTPNPSWSEFSLNFGTPICDDVSCGLGTGSGPADGDWWAWFGGTEQGEGEEASLSQSVTIPGTATELTFDLEVSACDSASDYLEVLVDGVQEYIVRGNDALCGSLGYTPQTIDISAYASGGAHTLEFHAQTFSTNLDVTNFFVDNVRIPGVPSQCNQVGATRLTLQKTVVNDHGGSASASQFQAYVDGQPVNWGVQLAVDPGTYAVSEDVLAGYAAGDWGGDCDAAGNVTLAEGENKTCTITNDDIAPTLTVIKVVENDDGGSAGPGDFTIQVTATEPSLASFPGAAAPGTTITLDAGPYSVGESVLPPGYALKSASPGCAGTIGLGENRVCTLTNEDVAPTLTLVKTVVNDHGGTAIAGQFQAYIDDQPVSWSVAIPVDAGAHSVREDLLPSYAAGPWTGDCDAAGNVSLALGQHKTCSIVNDDIAPSLTVIKVVENNHGGTALPGDFTIEVTATEPSLASFPGAAAPGTTITLDAGPYSVGESALPPGYALKSASPGCSGTIGLGENRVCTLTNEDRPTTLTLVKTVVNDHGGDASASQFQAYVDGQPVDWGVQLAVDPGAHAISEDVLAGYAAGDWGGDCDATGNVTLAEGENKTCTITNDDIAPTLTVTKIVENNHGGTAVAGDFTIEVTATEPSLASFPGAAAPGTTITLDAGPYSVGESVLPPGYALKSASPGCAGTIGLGENRVCTLTNEDVAPTLTLVKTVVNDHGGTAIAGQFQAYIDDQPVSWSVAIPVDAGAHSVREDLLPGYAAGPWTGDCDAAGNVSVALGQDKTCRITNNDVPDGDPVIFRDGFETPQ